VRNYFRAGRVAKVLERLPRRQAPVPPKTKVLQPENPGCMERHDFNLYSKRIKDQT
jgi:hypothetical protein